MQTQATRNVNGRVMTVKTPFDEAPTESIRIRGAGSVAPDMVDVSTLDEKEVKESVVAYFEDYAKKIFD